MLNRGVAALYDMPWLLLVLTTLFWGGNAVAGRLAVGNVGPVELVTLRWLLVAAILWPLYGREVRDHWHIVRPHMAFVAATAAIGFTGFNTLFYFAAERTTAVNIGILQGSMPVLVMIGAYFFYRTKVTRLQMLGVAVTLCGVVTVATQGRPFALSELDMNPGDAIMLVACCFYAAYTIALQRRPGIPGRAFFTLMSVVAMVTSLPLLAWEGAAGNLAWPTWEGWAITLYVAIFPSCLAQLFFMRGVDLIGPGRAMVYANLVPVFAAGLAVLLLGELFHLYHAAALALVLGGIALAQKVGRR